MPAPQILNKLQGLQRIQLIRFRLPLLMQVVNLLDQAAVYHRKLLELPQLVSRAFKKLPLRFKFNGVLYL